MYLYYNIKQTGKSSGHRGNAKDWSYMLTNVFILKNKTKKQRKKKGNMLQQLKCSVGSFTSHE